MRANEVWAYSRKTSTKRGRRAGARCASFRLPTVDAATISTFTGIPRSPTSRSSADELRAVWGPFVSEAGTYEVTPGSFITMRPIASKNPAVMGPGVFITYAYKLDGDTLSLTQQRNQNGPFANPFTLKLVRVE